jgi:hypothetical protein
MDFPRNPTINEWSERPSQPPLGLRRFFRLHSQQFVYRRRVADLNPVGERSQLKVWLLFALKRNN